MQSAEGIARSAAAELAGELGPALPAYVERRLEAGTQGGKQFLEPGTSIALASLLVSMASLAWTIYRDLRKETEKPSLDVVRTRVRVQLEVPEGISLMQRDRMIAVVVEQLAGED